MAEQVQNEITREVTENNADVPDSKTSVPSGNESAGVEEDSEGKLKINSIDFGSLNYKDFEEIDRDHIDLYYALNDNRNNPEFLDEDLVKLSKKEEEIRALSLREKEEFDFEMEELVDENRIKVDLTGIVDN
ncbi:MAG: hypothetical protein LBB24_03310 [Rickettsiales bacterium]|jgi:hypothetical protein|nr:hypothetical protein [Rickettsiales bacterium]